jgi:hypothetical protein
MTFSQPRSREERLREVARASRSLWMTEPNVPAHARHEVLVRLTALELHIDQLDLAAGLGASSPADIELEITECESELRSLADHWDLDLVETPDGVAA